MTKRKGPVPIPAIERLMRRVVETPGPMETACWLITTNIGVRGYVQMSIGGGHFTGVHRVAYDHFKGPIPDGLQIDHLCRVRNCCNPEHLEAVTAWENQHRGNAPSQISIRTGLCKRGHSMENCYTAPDGRRRCRVCYYAQQAEGRQRHKLAS